MMRWWDIVGLALVAGLIAGGLHIIVERYNERAAENAARRACVCPCATGDGR